MTSPRSYRALFLALAVIGLAADQASKYVVFRWLYARGQAAGEYPLRVGVHPRGEYDLIPGWFKFAAEFDADTPPSDGPVGRLQTWNAPVMPRVNSGALFGLGGGQKGLANWGFAAVSLGAAVGILVWGTRKSAAADRWLMVALALILGGAVGNLYDRLVFGGVRDFLFFYRELPVVGVWPVFNVADCGLVVGTAILLLQMLFAPTPKPAAAPAATAGGA
jgi:signal peptidase II